MHSSRVSFWFRSLLAAAAAGLVLLTLASTASAFGSIRFKRTTIEEVDGRWKFHAEVDYGSKPHLGHIPFDFIFLQTTYYEYSITDNDPKPVQRRKPMHNQQPQREQMDIGFADARGDTWRRTKFSFSLRRDRGFTAGEYKLTIKRSSDGQILGRPMKIILNGQNDLSDRRSIDFTGKTDVKKPDKKKAATEAAADKPEATADAAEPEAEDPVPEDVEPPEDPVDIGSPKPDGPPPVEKRPNGTGCGCRTAGAPSAGGGLALLGLMGLALLGWSRRRS
ncbi:MAG: MYXO-CTERM sorting domain-containing protein [Myxococcota bacterium]